MFELFFKAAAAGLKSAGATSAAKAQSASLTESANYYDRQAVFETAKGEYDVARHREATERVLSKQRNQYLGMGFSLDGTPTDVAFDSINESEKDVFAIRWSAQIRSENYKAEARNSRSRAVSAVRAGAINSIVPWLEFGGSVLGSKGATSFGKSLFSMGGGGGIPYAPDDI